MAGDYQQDGLRLGLTFSDVLLVPRKTPLNSRSETDIKTKFTRNVSLNIPLASSNMASVTEHKMAIAMARNGGIGVIHQFCPIQEQCEEVRKVKKSTSYIISDPLSVPIAFTLGEALEAMSAEEVTSVLVMDAGKLAGILTSRDYLFESDLSRPVSELMTKNLITAPFGISLDEAKGILGKNRIEKLPLLREGKLKGLITTQDIKKLEHWGNAARDEKGRLLVAAAVGVKDSLERAQALVKAGADVIVLDIAHAHSDLMMQRIKELKQNLPVDVMAGNVATAEAAEDLIAAGADGLKVGIGSSPVCTTRTMSGSGVPQVTAVMDVAAVAARHGIPVSSDGGAKYPGDAAKALAAGASTVYSGSFFAGTDEAPGMVITKDGKRYKRYMGSASYDSNHERKEKLEGRAVKERIETFVEGVSTLVDYKGPVEDVIKGICNGIRSGLSYCGARNIAEMQKNAKFIRITAAGWNESLTHGQKLSE